MSARDQRKVPQTNLLPGNPACIRLSWGLPFPSLPGIPCGQAKSAFLPPGQAIRVILLILLRQWKGLTHQGPLSNHSVSNTKTRELHVNVECTSYTIRK